MRIVNQIKVGAYLSYLTILIHIVTGIVLTPWIINRIGQEEYGLYSLALTLISFFTLDFGLGEAISRFLSKFNSKKQEQNKRDFLGIILKFYLVINLLVLISLSTLYFFIDTIYSELTIEELVKFKVIFIIASLFSVASFPFISINGVLIAYERFAFLKFLDLFNKLFTMLTMVIVLLLNQGLYALVVVNVIISSITIAAKLYFCFRQGLLTINISARNRALVSEIFSFSIWTTIALLAGRFVFNIVPSILGALSGTIQISIFYIAMSIEGYVWSFANALNGLFLPRVTKIFIEPNSSEELLKLMVKVGRIQFSIIGLIVCGFITVGSDFIMLWIGNDFSISYYAALLLILPSLITSTQQIANTALIAVNKIKYRSIALIVVAGISVSLSILFTPSMGAIGAALAIFIGVFIGQIIIMNVIYYRVLKINIFKFFKECHLKMCSPLIVVILLGFSMEHINFNGYPFFLIVKIIGFSLIYSVLMWYFVLNDYEKSLLGNLLSSILKKIKLKSAS